MLAFFVVDFSDKITLSGSSFEFVKTYPFEAV